MALLAEVGSWAVASGTLVVEWRRGATRRESLARAAHELRGPLTAIGLGLGAGHRAALEFELRRAQVALEDLDALAGGSRRVRAGAGRPRRLEPVELDRLLSDSAAAWSALARALGAEILPPPPTAEPAIVLGDPARLVQATSNLIANALEHGGGPVRVRCRVSDATARIEVSDCGPGLPAPVEALVGPRRRRERGSRRGHGLRVAAAVASAHGGRLSAGPAEVGARLVLELPRFTG